MKMRSIALAAHQASESTSVAKCTRIERRDGLVLALNSSDDDIVYNGDRYIGRTGVAMSALAQQSGAAVDNAELRGFLDEESVTEPEIVAARWDGAFVTTFELNYADLSMGVMRLATGTLGGMGVGRTAFNAEFRSLTQALQQTVGDLYTANCRHTLGDAGCKVDLAPITVTGAFTAVSSRRVVTDTGRGEAADRFTAGLLRVTSGLNIGVEMEIAGYAAGVFSLVLPLPFNPAPGDTYAAVPGCRKRHARSLLHPSGVSDCIDGFSNILNFGGFPFVPGSDKVLGMGGTEGTSL